MARITLNIDDSMVEETVSMSEESAKKICNKLPKSVSYFNIDVDKVLTPVEKALKFKTAEPIQCEPGECILYNWEGADNG